MADRDDLTDSFLSLVDEAFRRLLDEPDALTGLAVNLAVNRVVPL